MGLVAKIEPWQCCEAELEKLWPQHWREATRQRQELPLEMNRVFYRKAARAGALITATLRSGARLVGYWTVLVGPFLHSVRRVVAHTDLVFILPEMRRGRGLRLLHDVLEAKLRTLRVSAWFAAEKAHSQRKPLFPRLGFELEELSYVKMLGGRLNG